MNEDEMQSLREGIRHRYETYRLEKPGRYPKLKFNSYPAAYDHLQESFREELSRQGLADMQQAIAAIPSNRIFAKIFHDDYLLRDEKLIDTCYLYSWGRTRDGLTVQQPGAVAERSALIQKKTAAFRTLATNNFRLAGLLALTGLAVYGIIVWWGTTKPATGLIISSPTHQTVVPREVVISGKVANAKTVWVVVRYIKGTRHWVQPPIEVSKDGTWQGIIYIGSTDKGDHGLTSQVRAFVNPTQSLAEGDILYAWPEAELVTEPIEVVRGSQSN